MASARHARSRSRLTRLSRLVAAVLLLTGCFHYVPASVTPLPGARTEVRLTLTEPVDFPMGEFTLNDVTRMEGIVSEANGDTLGLLVRWLHPNVGRKHDAMLGSYTIPVSRIGRLERWRLSGTRTAIVAALAAAGVVALIDLTFRALGGPDPGGPPPDSQSIIAPR